MQAQQACKMRDGNTGYMAAATTFLGKLLNLPREMVDTKIQRNKKLSAYGPRNGARCARRM